MFLGWFVVLAAILLVVNCDDVIKVMMGFYNDITKEYESYTKKQLSVDRSEVQVLSKQVKFPSPKELDLQYDFIVVGGGSAGSVVASRLAEVENFKVLLLEAGKVENFLMEIPPFSPAFQFTKYNWAFKTEPQKDFARGLKKQRVLWPQGKALGGTSTINYLIYARGHPHDYDKWEAHGNPGWSYKEVLPYFLRSENSTLRHANYDYHYVDGYLHVEDTYQTSLSEIFVEAGGERGYHKYVDYNSPHQMGFSTLQTTTKYGRRYSTARAFLEHAKHWDNLHIVTKAHVTKILIDPVSRRAYGVEYFKKGTYNVVHSKKEVIISAGVVNSPKLLMLSGIGPKHHLESVGIPPIVNLPVGQTLRDRLTYFGIKFLPKVHLSITLPKLADPVLIKDYFKTGEGPLSSPGGEGLAYIQTNTSWGHHQQHPNLELLLVTSILTIDFGLIARKTLNVRDDFYKAFWGHILTKPYFSIFPMVLHPKSVGYMKLRSKDPFDEPYLYGNYLSDPEGHDLKTLIEGIRFVRSLVHTKAFKKFDVHLDDKPVPGCKWYAYDSDEYWECAIRTFSCGFYELTGTNRMGPVDDPHAVVDHELNVYGVKGLRVVDASVVPVTLGGYLNAVAVMIGEKASDLIKGNWKSYAHAHPHHH